MFQQYSGNGKPVTPNTPWLVDNIYQGYSTETISETLNLVEYEKDASGVTVVKELSSRRIFDRMGGKLGSYWGNEENTQYIADIQQNITGVVLTDGSAAVAITDTSIDLEKIFESATKARYVLKLIDRAGKAYYGFIGGISASSNVYTISVYSEVGLSNQNWVKTWGTGIALPYAKVEIYEYSTSIEFGSSDTFTEELPYSEYSSDYNQLKSLTDGQYRIDYRRGRFLGRKANADDTEVITYIGLKSGEAAADVDVTKWGGIATPVDDSAFTPGTSTGLPAFAVYDDTATDSVDEGDMGAFRMSADRVLYFQGAVAHDAVDSGKPVAIGGIAKSSQQTAVADADRVKAVLNLYGELVNAGYTWATQSNRAEEIDPISTHYLNESLLDTTNISAATHYYPSSTGASMDGYKGLSVTGKLIDADGTLTVTVEATNDEDTTSGDWEDVTATFIDTSDGAVGGAYTVTNGTLIFGFYNPDFNFRYYRIVVVADGATNTVILKTRKLY
uniref:Uncharacterized protein n=3 Tax=viral metagenome TaxID=1070528 RepID=A0A6M3KPE3_9ZZZZ